MLELLAASELDEETCAPEDEELEIASEELEYKFKLRSLPD